jgi:hypothetical protein
MTHLLNKNVSSSLDIVGVSKFVESLKLSSHCQAISVQFMLYGPFVEQKLKFKLRYCWCNQINRISKNVVTLLFWQAYVLWPVYCTKVQAIQVLYL